jgi:hypothetical protein
MNSETEVKVPLGRLLATNSAIETIPPNDIHAALRRHVTGDWGDLSEEDRLTNEFALIRGERLFSAYHSEAGVKYYVITEWDRSVTTVLLPEDY